MYTSREPEIRGEIVIAGTGAQVPAFDLRGSNRILDRAAIALRATRDNVMRGDLANGDFNTLGAGGDDVFADWVESAAGTSTVEQDTTTYAPESACKITLDASHSAVSLTTGAILEAGKTYTITFELVGTPDAKIWIEHDGGSVDVFTATAERVTQTVTFTATGTTFNFLTADDTDNDSAEIFLLHVVCQPSTPQDCVVTEFTGEFQASYDGEKWYHLVELAETDANVDIKSFSGTPYQYARFYVTSYTLDNADDDLSITYLLA